jgi:hypothetical protein
MTTTTPTTLRPTNVEPASTLRTVEGVHKSTGFHWVGDGFFVSTYFPSARLRPERTSPFVLMDYGPAREFTPLARGKRGVGWHPHRGRPSRSPGRAPSPTATTPVTPTSSAPETRSG